MKHILEGFGLRADDYRIAPIKTGHINYTYKLTGERNFILQRINTNVFQKPEDIALNIRLAANYLQQHAPSYFFLVNEKTATGKELMYDEAGLPWRLFPFVDNTFTIDKADTLDDAYAAAKGFGGLAANLWHCPIGQFQETIPRFHDLSLRYRQFEHALAGAADARKDAAVDAITSAIRFQPLVKEYEQLIAGGTLALHIMHNDTKINNILFDQQTRGVVSVIDLDTLMPGYFIYDLGDMIRTCVSPATEEERDTSQIIYRKEYYEAIVDGYFSAMGMHLPAQQRALAPFAGCMMTYIMALRFLADYLNGNVYYQVSYEEQNLVRAKNQLKLLQLLQQHC